MSYHTTASKNTKSLPAKQFIIAILALLVPMQAGAYTSSVTVDGKKIRWEGKRRYALAGNPRNRSGIDADFVFAAVVRGLQRWEDSAGAAVTYDYWQGSKYFTNQEFNGQSNIYFASNGAALSDPNVLGLTEVWFNTDSGEILEADIVLNDINHRFTTDINDRSGHYLDNIVSHELGHGFGLSHSGNLQSTMLSVQALGQLHLGCDDQVGLGAHYDHYSGGLLRGRVVSESGNAIFGAHVQLISASRGVVFATGITDSNGEYSISALEPGFYYLMVEPYYAGAGALPQFYAGANTYVCGGRQFSRTFLTKNAGLGFFHNNLEAIQVGGGTTVIGDLTVRCSNSNSNSNSSGAYVENLGSSSMASAPVINMEGINQIGVVDRVLSSGGTLNYRITNLDGEIKIRTLAFSLYSPIQVRVDLLDREGNSLITGKTEPIFVDDNGYINFDSEILTNLEVGTPDVFLQVKTSPLGSSLYPGGNGNLDRTQFFVVAMSRDEPAPSLAGQFTVNAKCQKDEIFRSYSSPSERPPHKLQYSQEDEESVGFCGTLSLGGGPGGPPSAITLINWFFPWFLILFMIAMTRHGFPKFQLKDKFMG